MKELKPLIVFFKTYNEIIKYIKKNISKHNLDLNEFSVLEVIYHYQEITIQDINSKVLVAPSSLTYILNKLLDKKIIKRSKCKKDNRVTYISLTEEGRAYSDEIFNDHYDSMKNSFNILSKDDKEKLTNILKTLGYHFKELNNE